MTGAPPHGPPGAETGHFPPAEPCCGHAFDDALVCPCGVSWWTHQRLQQTCALNARGRNRGEEPARPRPPRGH